MKVKEHLVVEECIMNGVERGFSRAYKHTDSPSNDDIKESIYQAVLSEFNECFDYEPRESTYIS